MEASSEAMYGRHYFRVTKGMGKTKQRRDHTQCVLYGWAL